MFLVAITGGIATGKSTVTKIFKDNGISIIDADLIARQVVERGKPAWKKIVEAFGEKVLSEDREINRDILGKIIFNNIDLRRKLNEITHPVIHRTIFIQIIQNFIAGKKFIVMDLPLLFETGILLDFIHKIITVTCDEEIQVKRLMERNSFSEEDARKRIASQMPLEQKCQKSNFIIENSSNINNTEKEVLNILSILNSSNQHWKARIFIILFSIMFVLALFWLTNNFNFIKLI